MEPVPLNDGEASADLTAALVSASGGSFAALWETWTAWLERPLEDFDGNEDHHFEVLDAGERVSLGRKWFVWVPDPEDDEDGDHESHGITVRLRLADVPNLPVPAHEGGAVESYAEEDRATYVQRVEAHPVFTLLSACTVSDVAVEGDQEDD